MNFNEIVKRAGYKGERADYLVRKLTESRVRKERDLLNLAAMLGTEHLAGENVYEMGKKLHQAALGTEATDAAVELAQVEGVDIAAVKPTGKSGKVTKSDVERAAEGGE